jgi:hypothetical protein
MSKFEFGLEMGTVTEGKKIKEPSRITKDYSTGSSKQLNYLRLAYKN